MGSLYNCQVAGHTEGLICRVISCKRIAEYQIDAYFTALARYQLLKMTDYVVFPVGVCLDEESSFLTVIEPKQTSLYSVLHACDRLSVATHSRSTKINGSIQGHTIAPFMKRAISIGIARILNSLHSIMQPVYHGHLSSHNVFVELPENEEALNMDWSTLQQKVVVRLGQAEMKDLAKYASMFYKYRPASVWSSPEVLKQKHGMLEPTSEMDVYSFGLLLWELWHEKLPFDGKLKEAMEVVLDED